MNNTPRVLNRGYLILAGLLFAVSGAAFIAHHCFSQVQQQWRASAATLRELNRKAYLGELMLPANWVWGAVIALLALAAISAILVLRWQTTGRQTAFAQFPAAAGAAPGGVVTLQTKLAEQLLQEHLEDDARVLKVTVNSYQVGATNALKARLEMRRGAELSTVTIACQRAAERLTELLGIQIPLVFEIKNSVRSTFAGAQRVL